MADTQIVGSVSSEDGITWKLHPGNSASGLKGNTAYKVRPVGPEKTVTTLAELNLQTMTATISPNPPAAGQPFSVTFSTVPDSTPGLTGTGTTRTGTAPASGNVVINATKAGYNAFSLTAATTPAVAPTATGGALTLFQGSVFLEIPAITAGYPEPTLELTALTRNGTDIRSEMVGTDEIPNAVKTTSSTYSATWTISNGVSPDVTITRTLVVAAASITPTVEPVPARLYAGQTPAAIAGIATATDTANYTIDGATITSAQLQVNAENATTSTATDTADVVSVLVTASNGTTRRWTLSTVEYAVKFVSKGAGGWAVDINNLIPGTTNVTLGWDGGTKVTTRNAIEAGPVVNVAPTISLDGETFTVSNPGPWINEYSAGAITFSYQWRRNGANITGASGANATSYTRVAADAGTTTTLAVTATDANGPTTVVTNGIATPAAVSFEPYTNLPGHYQFQNVSTASGEFTFAIPDIGAANANRNILVFGGQIGNVTAAPTGMVIVAGGQTIPMTLIRSQASTPATPALYTAAYHAVVPLGTTAEIKMTMSASSSFRFVDVRRGVGNTISAHNSGGTSSGTTTVDAALSGATVGHKVVAFSARSAAANITWTNATELYDLDPTGGTNRYLSAADGVIPEGGALTVTTATAGGAQSAMIAIAAGA